MLMSQEPFAQISREANIVLAVLEEKDVDVEHAEMIAPLRSASQSFAGHTPPCHSRQSVACHAERPEGARSVVDDTGFEPVTFRM